MPCNVKALRRTQRSGFHGKSQLGRKNSVQDPDICTVLYLSRYPYLLMLDQLARRGRRTREVRCCCCDFRRRQRRKNTDLLLLSLEPSASIYLSIYWKNQSENGRETNIVAIDGVGRYRGRFRRKLYSSVRSCCCCIARLLLLCVFRRSSRFLDASALISLSLSHTHKHNNNTRVLNDFRIEVRALFVWSSFLKWKTGRTIANFCVHSLLKLQVVKVCTLERELSLERAIILELEVSNRRYNGSTSIAMW